MRLTAEERLSALIIFQTLNFVRSIKNQCTPEEAREKALTFFSKGKLKIEYLEIVDGNTLEALTNSWIDGAVCCIAAFCGPVRLIDNMQLD